MQIDPGLRRQLERQTVPEDLSSAKSRVKVCIYGPNGPGKTTTAVALAKKLIRKDQIVLFVDTNEGWLSLRNFPALTKRVKKVQYISVEQLYIIAEKVAAGEGEYANVGAIVLDDADFMSDQDLNRLWHERVAKGTSTLDPDKPERPEYLKLLHRFNEVLTYIYDQTPDVHLFMTAHDKKAKTKDGQTVLKVFPGFNPALSDLIQAKLSVCGYMTAKEIRGTDRDKAQYARTIQVHPTSTVDAKSRIGFDSIRYDIAEFMTQVQEWVLSGGEEDKEQDVIRRDIAAKNLEDGDPALQGITDDDSPVFEEVEDIA